MKRNIIPKSALTYLIVGLLINTLPLIISRYFPLPDLLRGLITGLGLALELVALVKIQRSRKGRNCMGSNESA
jgi:hypothetical protein